MELEIIKKLNNISVKDFINYDLDIKNLEEEIGIKFPKILFDFYKRIGVNSNVFKSVLNNLKLNNHGFLEIHINEQTGDKWGIDTNNNLFFKTFKGGWRSVKYSVKDFLINEIFMTSCYSQKFSAQGKCSTDEIVISKKNGFLKEIKTTNIDEHIDIVSRNNLKKSFYQSYSNDIIAINGYKHIPEIDEYYVSYGVDNKLDFENFISSFGKNWYAPWLGL